MTEPFDWDALTAHVRAIRTHDDAQNALRERIEAAFVPKGLTCCQCGGPLETPTGGSCVTPTCPLSMEAAAVVREQRLVEATARAEAAEAREAKLREALECVIASTHSHLDGRDLLAEMHPRKTLDVKRRVDGRETWFQGDWLSELWAAVKGARAALGGEHEHG